MQNSPVKVPGGVSAKRGLGAKRVGWEHALQETPPSRVKTFNLSASLQPLLEQMSQDMAVPIEGLVNQAIFNWAKLHGYLEPGVTFIEDEPQTTMPEAEEQTDWKPAGGGSFNPDPVSDSTAPSMQKLRRVVLVLAEREVVVDSERFMVGRDVSCDLTIDSVRISRQHAIVHVNRDLSIEVEDLGSSNGTWHQGQRITRRKLVDGDEIQFGDTAVRVEFR